MHVATYGILAQGYYQNSDTFTDGMKTLFVVLGVVMAVVVVGALFRGIGRVMAAPLPPRVYAPPEFVPYAPDPGLPTTALAPQDASFLPAPPPSALPTQVHVHIDKVVILHVANAPQVSSDRRWVDAVVSETQFR